MKIGDGEGSCVTSFELGDNFMNQRVWKSVGVDIEELWEIVPSFAVLVAEGFVISLLTFDQFW